MHPSGLLAYTEAMKEILKTWLKLALGRGVNRTYSQFGEDAVIAALFRHTQAGVYVDIGAYHPTLYSNTYALYRKGWHGVAIDPNPTLPRIFKAVRPRDTFLAMAIGTAGSQTYSQYKDAAYNSLSTAQTAALSARDIVPERQIQIPTEPLSKILQKQGVRHIDFMNIDVEGLDLEVLRSHDWSLPPEVIAVEDAHFNPDTPSISATYAFLREHGYKLEAMAGLTLIFRRQQ